MLNEQLVEHDSSTAKFIGNSECGKIQFLYYSFIIYLYEIFEKIEAKSLKGADPESRAREQ